MFTIHYTCHGDDDSCRGLNKIESDRDYVCNCIYCGSNDVTNEACFNHDALPNGCAEPQMKPNQPMNPNHGGKRAGAGRKPLAVAKKKISVPLLPTDIDALNAICKRLGLSQAKVIEGWIRDENK